MQVVVSRIIETMGYQYKLKPLNIDETNRLVNAAESFQERLIIFTLLDTGLQVGELAGLTKGNILWQQRRIVIEASGDGKQKKRCPVPMTPRVLHVLEHHFAVKGRFGMSERTIQRIVQKVANRAGITKPVSPHVLRHTFGVTCIRKGMSIVTVSRIVGHASLLTTIMYLNLLPEDVIEDVLRDFEEKW